MSSMTRQYTAAASHARSAAEKTADIWTQGARTLTDLLPTLPQVDLVPAVERYFDFVQRTVDLNRGLAVRWAQAAGTVSGTVRDRAESAGDVVRERAEEAGETVRQRAAMAERAAQVQAEHAEKVQRDMAEEARKARQEVAEEARKADQEVADEARKAERARARQAHAAARERYQDMTKAQLSDLLVQRGLPKSGNVNDLIERLVEADGK